MTEETRIANEDARVAEELFRQEKAKAADLYAAQQRQYQKRMERGRTEEAASDN